MVNEKRTYLMTRLAFFEKHHEKQLEGVQKFFRSDYIGRIMIKNGLRITVAYLLGLAGWGLYHAETLIADITEIDVKALGTRILFLYAVVLCLFLLFTYIVQTVRYARAKQNLYQYREMLGKLEKNYRMEDEGQRMPVRR